MFGGRFVATVFGLIVAGSCFAADSAVASTNDVVTLPTIVVEATRLGQTQREVPSHVDVIGRVAVESSGAQTTTELLEKRANIFVRKLNANPAMSQISMRGYGMNSFGRVKVIVDGEELNNPDMLAQELVRVPVRSVERVEVLHGPQTVLHGGDASAGVISIMSDTDSYEKDTVLDVHGGSWGTVGTHVGTKGGFEETGTTYFADFDFDRSDGWRENSQCELWSVKGGVRQHFDNGSWLGLKTFYSDTHYGLPGGIYYGRSSWGVDYGSWKGRARLADDLTSVMHNSVYGVTLSGRGVIDDERYLDGSFSFRHRDSSGYADYRADTYDWKLSYVDETRIFNVDNRFVLGTDIKLDALAASSVYDNDYTRFAGALFAHDEVWVLDAVSLFGGARGVWLSTWDDVRGQPGADEKGFHRGDGEAAGEAGVNWRPVDDMKVFAKWSHFYHAPLADEMFSYYGVPNMNLKPESGDNVEIGTGWMFLKDFNFNATYYHTELQDEIMYLNDANVNAPARTRRDGFETSLVWEREKVGSVGVLYNFVYARFAEGAYAGNLVPLVPRQQLRLFGEWFLVDWLAVNGGMRFVGEQRYGGDCAGVGGMVPSYCLFDIGVRVMPTWGWLDGFTFAMTIDNLFDKRYFDYGEYFDPWYVYPGAGRSLMFTIRYAF